ncbi:MAG: hypothetical protein Kow00109_21240 [Acidobacteriota bacterium]
MGGILDRPILETPFAVIDLETTGLQPGPDRIVEIAVVRVDPGAEPYVALETLVNPRRPMGATFIHGITDADVADAPAFEAVLPHLVSALEGCVVAAYNVYFDARFLEFELANAGFGGRPPHLCLMYLRPLLGLGRACTLGAACRRHGIPYRHAHASLPDALAAARLLQVYHGVLQGSGIYTFAQLAESGRYRFLRSFHRSPLSCEALPGLPAADPATFKRRSLELEAP